MTDKAERFSRDLKQKGVRVRVGHGGYRSSRGFRRLPAELDFELWISALTVGGGHPCPDINSSLWRRYRYLIDQNRRTIPVENLKLFCDLLANCVIT